MTPASLTVLAAALAGSAVASAAAQELRRQVLGDSRGPAQRYLNRDPINPTPGDLHAGIDFRATASPGVRSIPPGQVINADSGILLGKAVEELPLRGA